LSLRTLSGVDFNETDLCAETKTEVLETPVTMEVMDVPFPDGLKPVMVDVFHDGAVRGRAFVVPRLLKAITRFPTVPCLKNYLVVAYTVQKKTEQAVAATEALLEAHPDYLFGRAMAATLRIRKGLLAEALVLLGPSLRLGDLYPETRVFHISEVRAYYHAAGMYHLATGNEAACQGIIEALQHLVPDAPEVTSLLHETANKRIEDLRKRMEQAQRTAIRVKEPEIPATEDFSNYELSFLHDEIFALFDYGYDLPPAKIRAILGLPRESLVADLKTLLEDAIRTGPAVLREINEFDGDEFTGPHNALHFLAELKASEVLETVLDFFSQHSELLEMWLGETSFRELLYPYAESSLDRLAECMKQPGRSSIARDGVVEAVARLALRNPSRRAEVISWFTELLEFFAASPPEHNILDTEVVSGMVWQLCDMRAAETLPLIRSLYDLNLVSEVQVGTYESIEQDIVGPIDARKQRPAQPMMEYYRGRTTPETPPVILRGGIESLLERPAVASPQPAEPYAGRNDPCPCGSGRKFKKCCMP
jgi:hypothetical protein